ncbi:MAG TPA: hypothetical protein VI548_02145 [Chitinophagaceae bacterium]|nr:hypothetical protein [Chitinophagaceae bacterium]
MKQQFLLLVISALILSSCTTAYKTGQTPDDVYFSQAQPRDEYVRVNKENDRYRYTDDYYDDRYLRMKVQNRSRWNDLTDWYAYDRYGYRYNYYYGSYFNPYTSWNYYYNPYSPSNVVVVTSKIPASQISYEKPRNFNLNSYSNNNYNTVNNVVKGMTKSRTSSGQSYNNSNNKGLSNTLQQIFSSGNNNAYSAPTRNYNPTSGSSNNNNSNSSSSSSGSSSSSSSGEVSRPKRGGN